MDRTSRITGRAVGLALAGALVALSCRASSPAAVTEPSSGDASAAPRTEASAATRHTVARVDKPELKNWSITLPMVWIYGHVPGRGSADRMPALSPATTAAADRLYSSSGEHFDLDGLRLTTPGMEPTRPALLPSPADGPGILKGAPKVAIAAPKPAPLPLRFDGDRKLPAPVMGDVLQAHRDAFDVCYSTGAHLDPGLHGRADVDFLVQRDGHVGYVETHGQGLDQVPSCVSNVISKLGFAPPAAPVAVRAHFEKRASRPSGA